MKPARKGLYYTLTEAQEILELRPTEFRHEVINNKTPICLVTPPREFLLFKVLPNKMWQGLATCRYQGHFLISSKLAINILDHRKSNIGGSVFKLEEPSGLLSSQLQNPFANKLPIRPVFEWISPELSLAPKINEVYASTLPTLTKHPVAMMLDIYEKSGGDYDIFQHSDKFTRKDLDKQHLDFSLESNFPSASLRIRGDAINTLAAKLQKGFTETSQEYDVKDYNYKKIKNTRENQLHTLIEKLVTAYPLAKSKELWSLIETEEEAGDPQFDTDGILLDVGAETIEWISRNGVEQKMNRSSFETRVSKVKKSIKAKL